MHILFNSISTYVESVGRKRSIRRWNTLDSLECIFTGPTNSVESWIPQEGQSHPDYPTLTCDGSEVVAEAAGVTTLRTTYTGKYYGVGPVALGSSAHWGETSWTSYNNVNSYMTSGYVDNPDGSVTPPVIVFEFVSYTWACRYLIETATFKALSRSPGNIIGQTGGSVLSQITYRTGRAAAPTGLGLVVATLAFVNEMIDRQVNSLKNGWYEISETWGPEPIITTELVNVTETIVEQVFG